MGTWSVSITGNDTAEDLRSEYTAAFFKYAVPEAVERMDQYVRTHLCDESEEEEWCDYVYSLADFMWKKGILTVEIKQRAIDLIDSGTGLEIWAESGEKTLEKRKRVLAQFREKLISPMPPKKRIRPNANTERIFQNGDLIAIELQTAGKPFANREGRELSEEVFHACDGKYALLQLMDCFFDWQSAIAPEVKDYWAACKLFDGVYDAIPASIDPAQLKPARIHMSGRRISPYFYCESSMFYFKKRKYRVLGNYPTQWDGKRPDIGIYFSVNKPWCNPDSFLLDAMDKRIRVAPYTGPREDIPSICDRVVLADYHYKLSQEENVKVREAFKAEVRRKIDAVLDGGGTLFTAWFGDWPAGIATVSGKQIDHIYVGCSYRRTGFGTSLLRTALTAAGEGAYILIPDRNQIYDKVLIHICEKLQMHRQPEDRGHCIRFQYGCR